MDSAPLKSKNAKNVSSLLSLNLPNILSEESAFTQIKTTIRYVFKSTTAQRHGKCSYFMPIQLKTKI